MKIYILASLPIIVLIGIAFLAPIVDSDPNANHSDGQRLVLIICASYASLMALGISLVKSENFAKWVEKYIVDKLAETQKMLILPVQPVA